MKQLQRTASVMALQNELVECIAFGYSQALMMDVIKRQASMWHLWLKCDDVSKASHNYA